MSNTHEYLWERTGEADPEIAALETLLAPARLRAPVPRIEEGPSPATARRFALFAAAACIALVVTMIAVLAPRRPASVAVGEWTVVMKDATLSDAERVTLKVAISERRLTIGETGSAELRAAGGESVVVCAPGAVIDLVETPEGATRVRLVSGELYTQRTAARAPYELEVNGVRLVVRDGAQCMVRIGGDGGATVETKDGSVDIGWDARGGRLGAVTVCRIGGEGEVSTPRSAGATAGVRDALDGFDALRSVVMRDERPREEALEAVLRGAGSGDGVMLWNLAVSLPMHDRPRVWARIEEVYPGVATAILSGKVDAEGEAFREELWKAIAAPR